MSVCLSLTLSLTDPGTDAEPVQNAGSSCQYQCQCLSVKANTLGFSPVPTVQPSASSAAGRANCSEDRRYRYFAEYFL